MAHASETGTGFARMIETGSHRASARAVAEGRADIAAIDAVTWAQMRRWDRFTDRLEEAGRTRPTPALPYICAAGGPAEALLEAAGAAIAGLAPDDRAVLGLHGIVRIPAAAYLALPTPPAPAPGGPCGHVAPSARVAWFNSVRHS